MTNEEAIRQLESLADHCRTMQDEPGDIWEDDIKALDKAIKALEEREKIFSLLNPDMDSELALERIREIVYGGRE